MDNSITLEWYNKSYSNAGTDAQRKWPNEELCRFMGRNFFHIPFQKRNTIKICEVGCGSGANMRMLHQEGFDTYGVDLSEEAVKLLNDFSKSKYFHVNVGDMADLSYSDNTMDAIVDVFSSCCLPEEQYKLFCDEVYRCLKWGGGIFFLYAIEKIRCMEKKR